MSAEARRVTKTEVWVGWESQVVNGVYPLRRFLGGSNHSTVFLTEYAAENVPNAAIKLVPADTMDAEAQLVQWGAAAALSHPHLLRLLDIGRCKLSGRGYLFVVMEYADQTLAQILPRRALSSDEVTQLLLPTLDVLAALHYNNLVHSQLKPSNFLVVDDQLKLASDTIRPVAYYANGIIRTSPYDPPELSDGDISATGDVWGLGITLAEALTQHAPAWQDDRFETASLSAALPPEFADTVQRCLSRIPSTRPTVAELKAQYNPPPPPPAHAITVSTYEPPVIEPEPAPKEPPARRSSNKGMLWLGVVAAIVILVGVLVGFPSYHRHVKPARSSGDISRPRLQEGSAVPSANPAGEAATLAAADTPMRAARPEATVTPAGGPTGAPVGEHTGKAGDTVVVTPDDTRGGTAEGVAAVTPDRAPGDTAAHSTPAPGGTATRGGTPAPGGTAARGGTPAPGGTTARGGTPAPGSTAARGGTTAPVGTAGSTFAAAPVVESTAGSPSPPRPSASGPSAPLASAPRPDRPQRPAERTTGPSMPASRPAVQAAAPALPADTLGSVLHQQIPDVPRVILGKIRGHVNVTVRVLVDPSGNVVGEFFENAGPSRYFARVAGDAAGAWTFAPTEARGSRVWLLRFEFTREGASVRAVAPQ